MLLRQRNRASPRTSLDPVLLRPLRPFRDHSIPLLLRRSDIALGLLTLMIALQFLIPARKVISGLGAAGRPSAALALGLGVIWLGGWLCIDGLRAGRQPVRWITAVFLTTVVLTYGTAYARLLPEAEAGSANRRLLAMATLCALALVVADSIRDRTMAETILNRIVGFGGVMAAIGAVQALTPFDPIPYIRLPGLVNNADDFSVSSRGDGIVRVASTATHYIEFGVVLGVLAPLAIHHALYAADRSQRVLRWSLAALIIAGVPLSVSRSGMLALLAGLAVLAMAWTWRFRIRALAVALVATAVFTIIQPGRLGTIRALFLNAENDPSVQGRIADYAIVNDYFAQRPWIGRGLGTFIPDHYVLLDNEYLFLLMTSGIVGVGGFAVVLIGGYTLARSLRLRAVDERTRHLGQALAAAFVVVALSAATFDLLSFAMISATAFLLLGFTGALWRIELIPRAPIHSGDPNGIVATPLAVKWPRQSGDALTKEVP